MSRPGTPPLKKRENRTLKYRGAAPSIEPRLLSRGVFALGHRKAADQVASIEPRLLSRGVLLQVRQGGGRGCCFN